LEAACIDAKGIHRLSMKVKDAQPFSCHMHNAGVVRKRQMDYGLGDLLDTKRAFVHIPKQDNFLTCLKQTARLRKPSIKSPAGKSVQVAWPNNAKIGAAAHNLLLAVEKIPAIEGARRRDIRFCIEPFLATKDPITR
jgi:hypothetical protein